MSLIVNPTHENFLRTPLPPLTCAGDHAAAFAVNAARELCILAPTINSITATAALHHTTARPVFQDFGMTRLEIESSFQGLVARAHSTVPLSPVVPNRGGIPPRGGIS